MQKCYLYFLSLYTTWHYFEFIFWFLLIYKQFTTPQATSIFIYVLSKSKKFHIFRNSENVKFDLQYFNIIQTTSLFKSLMNSKIEEVFWNFEHSTLGVMKWALVWLMWIYCSCTNIRLSSCGWDHPCPCRSQG